MKRLHLFEIHDAAWCPRLWRDSITSILRLTIDFSKAYHPIIPKLGALMKSSDSGRVIDLCSGGAGPWRGLHAALEEHMDEPVEVCLTDKYPNLEAFSQIKALSPHKISFVESSVDATEVPEQLNGVRTLFSSFHHFRPNTAREILRDAAQQGVPIGVFEFTERSIPQLIAMLFAPLASLFALFLVRPFSWLRVFSYFPLPAIPLILTWDGLVSSLRTYSVKELNELISEIDAPDYEWEVGRIQKRFTDLPITYVIGRPK